MRGLSHFSLSAFTRPALAPACDGSPSSGRIRKASIVFIRRPHVSVAARCRSFASLLIKPSTKFENSAILRWRHELHSPHMAPSTAEGDRSLSKGSIPLPCVSIAIQEEIKSGSSRFPGCGRPIEILVGCERRRAAQFLSGEIELIPDFIRIDPRHCRA